MKFNHELLRKDIQEKKAEERLFTKQLCNQIGISKSCLSTIMEEAPIRLTTFIKCLEWLNEKPGRYLN